MLAINTIQTVMKDARMREQASLIQKEVGVLLNDVRLLRTGWVSCKAISARPKATSRTS